MSLLNLAFESDMGAIRTYYDTPAKVKSIKLLQAFIHQPYTRKQASRFSNKDIYGQPQQYTATRRNKNRYVDENSAVGWRNTIAVSILV